MKSEKPLKILSFERHAQLLRILLILDSEEKLNFQSFINDYSMSSTTLYRTLEALKELKLVGSEIDKTSYPNQNMIFLTEKGKKVAKHLKEIENILGGE